MRHRYAYGFLVPFGILFIGFFILPFLYAVYLSLHVEAFGVMRFAGLTNYGTALSDAGFWQAVERVFYYGVVQVTGMLLLAMALALFLDTPYAQHPYFHALRLIYFLPYAVPSVIAAIMWGFLYSPLLDPLLTASHLNPLYPGTILYAIMNIATWEWAGYNMILYRTGLTTIPPELYDAARLDGCRQWQLAWYVKLPLLRPTLVFTIVLSIIGSLQLFNEPILLSSLTAVPANFTPNMDIVNTAFSFGNIPYAATLSVILTVITIGATVLFLLATRTRVRPTEPAPRAEAVMSA